MRAGGLIALAAFPGAASAAPTITLDDGGRYVLRLEVRDEHGRRANARRARTSQRLAILLGIEPLRHAYGGRREQFGELTRPEGRDAPWPVAVQIHGGYWRARYDLRLQDPLVPDLAARGWAVWNLEYRRLGWRSRGGWPATFEDVAAGVDCLGRLDEPLDLGRVVVIGHSAGGHLALWAAARRGLPAGAPGAEPAVRPSGVVAQAGVLDLREAARLSLSRGAAVSLLGGPPGKLPRRYDLASPIERLPLGVPQLLVHGDADDSVPIEISRRYAERARQAGDPCELVELPGCGHFEHLDPTSHAWGVVTEWLEQRSP